MKKIKILDKEFKLTVAYSKIAQAVEDLASRINSDFAGEEVLFISILNGSFMFTAELLKNINLKCKVSFIKVKSYSGDCTTGDVTEIIGLNESVEGKNIILIEDIVDTGTTISKLFPDFKKQNPASLKIATLLFKPLAYHKNIPVDYVGLEMPNDFLIGFGLDYDGYGRNLPDLYKVV